MNQLHAKSVVVGVRRRRDATVRQIDRRLNSWVRRYPDIPVQVVAAGTGVRLPESHGSAIELAVVGRADAELIAEADPRLNPKGLR